MPNKVKFNLKNVHYAKMTATTANGTTTYTYEDPAAIPGAVSMSLSAESSNEPFYADGVVYYRAIANNGYSGELEMALVPDAFRTDILNETLDGAKVLVEKANSAEPNKFALLFEFEGDSKCIRHVLYCCSAERPSIESSTTEGSKSRSLKNSPLQPIRALMDSSRARLAMKPQLPYTTAGMSLSTNRLL